MKKLYFYLISLFSILAFSPIYVYAATNNGENEIWQRILSKAMAVVILSSLSFIFASKEKKSR